MIDKRLVIVEWTDAGCDSNWQNDGTVLTCPTVWTAGFLLHEDGDAIMIGGTVCSNGDFNQTMTIPVGMIKEIKDVARVNPLMGTEGAGGPRQGGGGGP